MSDLKTQPTGASVTAFVKGLKDERRRLEAKAMLNLMKRATGLRPRMWGTSLVGYGRYRYKYASGRSGEWFLTGFSPRKADFVVYIMPGFKQFRAKLKKLGPHRTGASCLYLRKLEGLDLNVLETVVAQSVDRMREIYPEQGK